MQKDTAQTKIAHLIRECCTAPRFGAQHMQHMAVVPTYAWNGAKPDIPEWHTRFPTALSLAHYKIALERFTTVGEIRTLTFNGGEPTLWAELDEALFLAHAKNIVTVLETNTLAPTKRSTPKIVRVNFRTYLTHPTQRRDIQTAINTYTARGTSVIGILPLQTTDAAEDYANIKSLSDSLNIRLLTYPTFSAQRYLIHIPAEERTAIQLRWQALIQAPNKLYTPTTPWWEPRTASCRSCPHARLTLQPDGQQLTLCPFYSAGAKWNTALTLTRLYEKTFAKGATTATTCPALTRIKNKYKQLIRH